MVVWQHEQPTPTGSAVELATLAAARAVEALVSSSAGLSASAAAASQQPRSPPRRRLVGITEHEGKPVTISNSGQVPRLKIGKTNRGTQL